jgi:hypothetical protein
LGAAICEFAASVDGAAPDWRSGAGAMCGRAEFKQTSPKLRNFNQVAAAVLLI